MQFEMVKIELYSFLYIKWHPLKAEFSLKVQFMISPITEYNAPANSLLWSHLTSTLLFIKVQFWHFKLLFSLE